MVKQALRLTVVFVMVLGLAGCASQNSTVMPEVTGKTLDVAKSDIQRAGIKDDVEVLGGGVFGVVKESNWEVCEQSPLAGAVVTDTPRLTVARSCSQSEIKPSATPDEETPEASPEEPAASPVIDAKAIEEKFKEHLHNNSIDNIGDMCDADYTHWACFYDGVESGSGYLRVNLTTDGGWTDGALSDMADKAGRHWFNFIGCDFPDLKTIVVRVNGSDFNVFRSDTSADALCN